MNDDPFVLLQMPRRPLLDLDALTLNFQTLAGQAHPDRGIQDSTLFAALNSARSKLADPALRLMEIFRLENGRLPVGKRIIPAGLENLFVETSELTTRFDAFLVKKYHSPGMLAKALMADEEIVFQEELQQIREELGSTHSKLNQALVYVDNLWETTGPEAVLPELIPLADAFAYVSRWQKQIDERLLKLIL